MSVQKLYDDYWDSGLHVSKEWEPERFQKVMGPILSKQNVLDYGCGMGHAYQRQLALERTYSGADVSTTALENAAGKGFPTYQINTTDGSIDCAPATFDAVTCVEVFEHLQDPLAAARELLRVMSPGGVLIATVPNFGYHAWRIMAFLRAEVPSEPENKQVNRHNGVHIRFFCPRTLKGLLNDAGFVEVKVGSFDDATIWDVFRGCGPLANISDWARRHLPPPFHLRFLQDLLPSVFAYRLRAVAVKPME